MTPPSRAAARLTPQVVLGLAIVAFGLLLTADNLDYLEAGRVIAYWPLILVAFGFAKLFQSDTTSGRLFGVVLIAVGGWMTADELWGVPLNLEQWWPVALVVLGVLIISRGFRGEPISDLTNTLSSSDTAVSEFAFWSGKVRRNASASFRRADITAIMGGVELDLRAAGTGGQEAVIDVFVWWGGVEITVPPDWVVSNQVVAIMAGADDSSSGTQDARHRLVVRGFVVMGGIEIKTQ
jgi:predicted membrane protein